MLRLVIESAPSGTILVDPNGKIILVNSKIENLFGYERMELIGETVEKLVPVRLREKHPKHRADFRKHPSAREMGGGRDLFGCRKNGTEFPVEVGLAPIERPDGLYILAVVVDISERKRQDQQLRETQKLESIGLLAGGIA